MKHNFTQATILSSGVNVVLSKYCFLKNIATHENVAENAFCLLTGDQFWHILFYFLAHIILFLYSIDKNTTRNKKVICWQLYIF